MDISSALQWAFKHLRTSNSPDLDAEVLLSFALKKPKEFLYAHPQQKITKKQDTRYKQLINRRAKGEPVAYLTGQKEFYGLDFKVNKNVLIPRPETELIIETLKHLNTQTIEQLNNLTIVDVGTGSGCIPIALATSLRARSSDRAKQSREINGIASLRSQCRVFATDISKSALVIAKKNARRHGVKIKFLRGNLLKPIISNFINLQISNLILTANLPYLTTRQWRRTPPDVRLYEPRQALDGGPDGLKYFRELFSQIKNQLFFVPCSLFLEIDPSQTAKIKQLSKKYFPAAKIQIKKDLAGRDRVIIIKIKKLSTYI